MNVSHLPVGIYLLELKQGNERTLRKMIKTN
ncbi:hypothetical protein [Spirosoma sp.]